MNYILTVFLNQGVKKQFLNNAMPCYSNFGFKIKLMDRNMILYPVVLK